MAEIEVLKLAGWQKILPQELGRFHSKMLSPAGINELLIRKLLYQTCTDQSYRLTALGWDFVSHLGFSVVKDSRYVVSGSKLQRRKEAALISFALFRAGINIFTDTPDALATPLAYLSSAAARRNTKVIGSKLWAGNRLAGIACMSETAYMIHFLNGQGMFFTSEMDLFHKLAFRSAKTACIYAADSYEQAVRCLKAPQQESLRGGCISFRDAFGKTTLPVHLLECSDVGVIQLQIMSRPNYREELARLALGNAFTPPLASLPDADAMTEGVPLVIGVDMDIKRLERACLTAKAQGFAKTLLLLLPKQLPALGLLFHTLGAEFCAAPEKALRERWYLVPYEPSEEPYQTAEGRFIHASDIPTRRKAGRPHKPTT